MGNEFRCSLLGWVAWLAPPPSVAWRTGFVLAALVFLRCFICARTIYQTYVIHDVSFVLKGDFACGLMNGFFYLICDILLFWYLMLLYLLGLGEWITQVDICKKLVPTKFCPQINNKTIFEVYKWIHFEKKKNALICFHIFCLSWRGHFCTPWLDLVLVHNTYI